MSSIKAVWAPRTVFSWKIVKIVHQDMKKWEKEITYERAERAPWVRLILIDSKGNICLTKEHRTELNGWAWWFDYRLPGGKVFDTLEQYNQHKQDWSDIIDFAIKAAHIEAKEEVGATGSSVQHVHTSGCGATMWRDLYYFEMKDFTLWEQELDWMEHIEVLRYSEEEAKKLCLNGSMHEDRSVAVLLRYLFNAS